MAPNYGIKLAFSSLLCQKKKTKWQTSHPDGARFPATPRSMGADFYRDRRGRVTSVRLANRFGTRFETNTKLLRGVIRPISTPNDYLNTVFDDVVSLCRSCRNNVPPRSPREKLRLVAILPLREKKLSLQKRSEYVNCVDRPRQTCHGLLEGLKMQYPTEIKLKLIIYFREF